MLAIFFLPVESAAVTIGESFTPPDNLLIGESEVLRALGEACFRPVGDGCRYLDGTIIDGSLEDFPILFTKRQSSLKLIRYIKRFRYFCLDLT
uniref:Uncharacterized protein n=1 Tax=Fagus sylvatica TaxID=28930 RepID=A0A2N9H0Z2_FAGSY